MNVQPEPSGYIRKYVTKHSEYLFDENRGRAPIVADPDGTRGDNGTRLQPLVAAVRWHRGGGHEVILDQWPIVGDSLLLGEAGRELLTTRVLRIERVVVRQDTTVQLSADS